MVFLVLALPIPVRLSPNSWLLCFLAGTESETKAFMAVCIETAKRYNLDDYRTPVFIFERLCSIIYPVSSACSHSHRAHLGGSPTLSTDRVDQLPNSLL